MEGQELRDAIGYTLKAREWPDVSLCLGIVKK